MFEAVHDVTARGIECFPASPRHEWVLQWPGMVVLVVTAVYWCVLLVLSCAVLCRVVFLYSPRVGPAVAWHGGAGGHSGVWKMHQQVVGLYTVVTKASGTGFRNENASGHCCTGFVL